MSSTSPRPISARAVALSAQTSEELGELGVCLAVSDELENVALGAIAAE